MGLLGGEGGVCLFDGVSLLGIEGTGVDVFKNEGGRDDSSSTGGRYVGACVVLAGGGAGFLVVLGGFIASGFLVTTTEGLLVAGVALKIIYS